MTEVIHDAAGPCEPDYHRGMPSWATCRCKQVRRPDNWPSMTACGARVTLGHGDDAVCSLPAHSIEQNHLDEARAVEWASPHRPTFDVD